MSHGPEPAAAEDCDGAALDVEDFDGEALDVEDRATTDDIAADDVVDVTWLLGRHCE
jgi:hypothetical protein